MTYAAIQQLIRHLPKDGAQAGPASASARPSARGAELHAALSVADDGAVLGRFFEFKLASGFQRLVRLDDHGTVGYDAYARSHAVDGDVISPWGLFSRAADDETLVRLDRLCRLVHTLNYFAQAGAGHPLYLRVHGRLLAAITHDHGQAFRHMVEALGVPASGIVLQLPAEAASDVLLAGIVLNNYKKAGFKAGVHANNVEEARSLLHLHAPDVIKLDANLISRPEEQIPPLLEAAAAATATQVVFKHVETDAMARRLAALGAQYAQGYLFGLPAARLSPCPAR